MNLGAGLKVIVQDIKANSQITSIEWIDSVPALSTELSPLRDHSVEVAERKENRLEFGLLCATLKGFLKVNSKALAGVLCTLRYKGCIKAHSPE